MNIFVLDKKPAKAATMLCDCHLRKMCVETAQILSGVMLRRGMELLEGMPKPQNINHPVIVAAAADPEALLWVVDYNEFLHIEHMYRFRKSHAYNELSQVYTEIFNVVQLKRNCQNLAKCTGDLYVGDLDIVTAYRKYYKEVKKPQLQAKGLWNFTSREDWTI
jgi:hypothetical protein